MYQLPPIFCYTQLTERPILYFDKIFPEKNYKSKSLVLNPYNYRLLGLNQDMIFQGHFIIICNTKFFFCKVMSISHRLCFVTGWWIWNEMHQICILQCKWNVMSECKWARILLFHTFLVADMWWMYISCFIILFENMLIFVI